MIVNLKKRLAAATGQDWDEQIKRVIGFANLARLTIFFALMVFYALSQANLGERDISQLPNQLISIKNVGMYVWFGVYGCVIYLTIVYPEWQIQKNSDLPNASSVIDITMIAWLMYLLDGIASGFGILILPFLVVACLLNYGRYWMLYSGYACLLVLIVMLLEYYPFDYKDKWLYLPMVARTGMLCVACYGISWASSFSASYLSSAGESVQRHRTAFERVSALNKVVLNQVQEAVLVVDRHCKIWLCNRKANEYFADVRIGYPFMAVQDLVRRWRGFPNRTFETRVMIHDNDMSVRGIPVIQIEGELLILFIRAERELQMEAQSVKLASLGLLTANLAHEIRNPLSAMRQANGLIMETYDVTDDLILQRLTNMIDNNIARIDKMIEDVSMLNKSDRVNRENIHLGEFWKSFRQEFILTQPDADDCLKSSFPMQTQVVFDPMHLQQILWNLCNNAWRHCSKNAKNAIKVVAQNINPHQVSLVVQDDGGGVPVEIIPHLFEPFYTTQAHAKGTGLGLYVARELAHANKGDLRYLPDKKAFEIILPRANHYD
ncbi:ATP-binding protein [Alysiella filiformis]|uniref:histidine kinase n=1 Tax=Alysiella filiformis DSM 16848 TaxID=1120981 RepID=A0A286EFL9_9NEIS|nr:HAMP domain-containing sensor histidine kinase [Alysiella filiformis]QMT30504.1 HAMP domain-containing histidine kinase [Alysiella filiformis]UBQ56516.1 HAMP domain-containing histidine kinase [Alysiella filiformis DSM 16848]SOD69725.1 two-component system, NtrC family, sensor histidine kinase PilS [Alysiella filiformis DSM 16848]